MFSMKLAGDKTKNCPFLLLLITNLSREKNSNYYVIKI